MKRVASFGMSEPAIVQQERGWNAHLSGANFPLPQIPPINSGENLDYAGEIADTAGLRATGL
jgi:hypothetical protein